MSRTKDAAGAYIDSLTEEEAKGALNFLVGYVGAVTVIDAIDYIHRQLQAADDYLVFKARLSEGE